MENDRVFLNEKETVAAQVVFDGFPSVRRSIEDNIFGGADVQSDIVPEDSGIFAGSRLMYLGSHDIADLILVFWRLPKTSYRCEVSYEQDAGSCAQGHCL